MILKLRDRMIDKKIKVTKNGPYQVSGKIPLKKESILVDVEGISEKWGEGQEFEVSSDYALCRCGNSKNKPFCDSSHVKSKFDGIETAGDELYLRNPETTDGPVLSLDDIEPLCSGSRFCDRKSGIWSLTENSNDIESKKIAIEEGCNCPSGRLLLHDKETGREIEPKLDPSISVVDDPAAGVGGPLWVKGGIPIESASNTKYETRNRVTLCRCGKSKNKPFCDASHVAVGFSGEN